MRWLIAILTMFHVENALGQVLTKWQSLDPSVRNTVPAQLPAVKGQSTDSIYAFEVDQTTGGWPIEGVAGGVPVPVSGTVTATNPSVGATGANVPADATYAGGINGSGKLTGIAVDSSGNQIVVGDGVAGTPAGGVTSIQGVSGGTPVPISGSISATNPSVGATGSAVPLSATYLGVYNASDLVGVEGDSAGHLITVGDGVAGTPAGGVASIQGVSGGTPVPISGSGSAGSAAAGVVTVQGIAGMTPVSVSGTVTSTISGTVTTDQVATTAATFQDGSIAAGSLTTSYQTVITTGGTLVNVSMRNTTNGTVVVSLNAGSSTSFTLAPGDEIMLDLKPLGRSIASSTALQAKYSGSAPTTGSIFVDGVY